MSLADLSILFLCLSGARSTAGATGALHDALPLALRDGIREGLLDGLGDLLVLDLLLGVGDEGLVLKVHIGLALHLLEEHTDLCDVGHISSGGVAVAVGSVVEEWGGSEHLIGLMSRDRGEGRSSSNKGDHTHNQESCDSDGSASEFPVHAGLGEVHGPC